MLVVRDIPRSIIVCLTVVVMFLSASYALADRIKDIVSIAGVRSNQLIGYGIVVGLNGSGDGSVGVTTQSLQSVITRFGMSVNADDLNPANTAAVIVTASLPPFAKPGQTIDVTVSAFSKASSLRGGSLILTPLKGADNKVYAIAQGSVAVGGLGISGDDGSSLNVNIPTVGRIPNGATVEAMVSTPFESSDYMVLNLHSADFTTVLRVADTINDKFGEGIATARDAVSVLVEAPADPDHRVILLSEIENLEVQPSEPPSRVIVNSRTGTIVMTNTVYIGAAAVSHGNLTVRIKEDDTVNQVIGNSTITDTVADTITIGGTPEPTVLEDSKIEVEQDEVSMFVFDPGVELSSIVDAINAVGATPADLIAILEALKISGALRSELLIM